MKSNLAGYLCDPVLESLGVPHGFAERGAQPPDSTVLLRQVHGARAVRAEDCLGAQPSEADALVARTPGLAIGVVTADCVPILAAASRGGCVAAIHAGWRGLAAGVIEAGISAMGVEASELSAAVGPAARGCCYEVDEPVARALEVRYAKHLPGVITSGRPGRYQLDLPALAARILVDIGLAPERIGQAHRLCTICTPDRRFESHRRDGERAGRLRHFIRAMPPSARPEG